MTGSQVGSGARRAQARAGAVVASAGVVIVLLYGGMAARVAAAPVWPSLLTDWSLGSVLLAASALGVGTVLVIRLPRNAVGWLFLGLSVLTALVFALRWFTVVALDGVVPPRAALWSAWVFAWVIPVNMTLLTLLALLFPHGRALSRRWRVAALVFAVDGGAAMVATMISPYLEDQTPFPFLANPVALLSPQAGRLAMDVTTSVLLMGLLAGAASLLLRLRRSSGEERQQVTWFVFAFVVAFTTYLVGFRVEPLFVVATLIGFPAVPVAAGVAVLRYRLYDIDRVINRTVVYAVVTGVLVICYLGTITGTRAVLSSFTPDTAPAVAASTLAVAALFQPLRRRVQLAVDQRFNRARYDAQATVDGLRARVRDEVDLDVLTTDLLAAVRATMQPAGTTLWLREAGR